MIQKIKSIIKSIYYTPFGKVIIYLWILLSAIVGANKLYFEIRYHLSDHIYDFLFVLGIILFGVTVSIISYFINKKKQKNNIKK